MNEWLTTQEAGEKASVLPNSLANLIAKHKRENRGIFAPDTAAVKKGKTWLINPDSFRAWLGDKAQHTPGAKPKPSISKIGLKTP